MSDALEALEQQLLGQAARYTEAEVVERSGVTAEEARHLWHLLGFAHAAPNEIAFTDADVRALQLTRDLVGLGILGQDQQDGLIRTWGRSFARLAEWQMALLSEVVLAAGLDEKDGILVLGNEVLPRVDELQSFAWRRHLLSVGARFVAEKGAAGSSTLAVCFVDIVGYTSRSRTLADSDLVAWLEHFESAVLDIAVDRGCRIIKNIGDELLLVADDPHDMAAVALELVRRGADEDDPFPAVRAGVAYGDVVVRLGDVFGPVVNIAARLTSVARPCTVLVDKGMRAALTGEDPEGSEGESEGPGPGDSEDSSSSYRLRRLRRVSVKGYNRLHVWALQPR
ncbi:MAG TPA: adenylate/guanylate cyclase domain-containing protein [Nocardioides sp.]|nr:adenylate/guanylate cyclase domain-containing protein [Nocardioides sp.]